MTEFIYEYWWIPPAIVVAIWIVAYLQWLWDRTGGSGQNSNRRGKW